MEASSTVLVHMFAELAWVDPANGLRRIVSAHGHLAIGQKSLAAGRQLVLAASEAGGPRRSGPSPSVSTGARASCGGGGPSAVPGAVAAAVGCVASLVGPVSVLLPGRRPGCSGSTLPPTGKGGMFEARALAVVATMGVAAGAAPVVVAWLEEVVATGGVGVAAASVRAAVLRVREHVHLTVSV